MEGEGQERMKTDVHWRCKTGTASWNYRIKIPIELPIKSRELGRLHVQVSIGLDMYCEVTCFRQRLPWSDKLDGVICRGILTLWHGLTAIQSKYYHIKWNCWRKYHQFVRLVAPRLPSQEHCQSIQRKERRKTAMMILRLLHAINDVRWWCRR